MLKNYKIHSVPSTERFRPGYGRRAYRIISDLTKNRGISSRVGIRWTLPKKSRSGGRWSGNMVYIDMYEYTVMLSPSVLLSSIHFKTCHVDI